MLRPFCRCQPLGARCGKCGKHLGQGTAEGKLDVGGNRDRICKEELYFHAVEFCNKPLIA